MSSLKTYEAWGYEFSVILGGTLLILLFQGIFGLMFMWMLWVLSLVVVILSYVDHCCVDWHQLNIQTQLRRILTDAIISTLGFFCLYWSLYFMLPRHVNFKSLTALITEVQKYLRLHNYFGIFIYTYLYTLFYFGVLGFFRVLVNTLYCFYMVFEVFYYAPSEAPRRPQPERITAPDRSSDHTPPPQPPPTN